MHALAVADHAFAGLQGRVAGRERRLHGRHRVRRQGDEAAVDRGLCHGGDTPAGGRERRDLHHLSDDVAPVDSLALVALRGCSVGVDGRVEPLGRVLRDVGVAVENEGAFARSLVGMLSQMHPWTSQLSSASWRQVA
eukprot:3001770-Pyramimonas_sp.AAC.1